MFVPVSSISVSQTATCTRISASPAPLTALYSDRWVQLGRFIAFRLTPHLIFYRSRINGDRQVEDFRQRLPLPLSHSTEVECALSHTASFISRHPLPAIHTCGCWQVVSQSSAYVRAFPMYIQWICYQHRFCKCDNSVLIAHAVHSHCTSRPVARCTAA